MSYFRNFRPVPGTWYIIIYQDILRSVLLQTMIHGEYGQQAVNKSLINYIIIYYNILWWEKYLSSY